MKYIRWLLTIAYAGFIFYLSSRTWGGLPGFPYSDKIFHAVLYFGFGGFFFWALRTTKLRTRPYIGYVAVICVVFYGLSDEIHQLFVSGREFSLLDLLADAVGAAIGIFVAAKLAMLLRAKQRIQ